MRKNLIPFLIIGSSMVLMAAMCNKDEVEEFIDPCNETALSSTIDVPFVFSAYIYYKDDVPYEGPVHFKVHKAYCEGTISGEYYLTHISADANGGWFSGMLYTYTYGNYDDVVWTTFTFESPTYENHKEMGAFSYGFVELYFNGWDAIEHTFQIHLPWNSPTKK
jgi:hypothetical protein